MKKKILFTIWALNTGGAERSLINLLNELDKNKYDIDLLLFDNKGEFLNQVPKEVRIIEPNKEIKFLNSGSILKMLKNFHLKGLIYRLIYKVFFYDSNNSPYKKDQVLWKKVWSNCIDSNKNKYDIAVGYMHSIPSYYVIDKVKADRKILWVHHDYSKLNADINFDFRYFNCADRVVTVSDICKKMLDESYPTIKEKFLVLKNITSPIVIEKLSKEYIPEEFIESKKDKKNIILSIGRLNSVKGFDMAIDAAKILVNRKKSFIWFIIGKGSQENELMDRIRKNGVEEYIKLIGVRSNPYVYIYNSDIIVQTSRNEGKSVVLDEAKILWKPIVSTNYDSVTDQIEDNETGILTEMNSLGIANGIDKLLSDEKLKEQLTNNLMNRASDIDLEMEVDKYIECFEGEYNES